ncbi:MAG: transposase [Solirubrobacterales bacterium]
MCDLRSVDPVLRSRRLRLYPTVKQEDALTRMGDARRFVYNWSLERLLVAEPRSETPMRDLTTLRREQRWLQEADSQALQQAVRDSEWAVSRWHSGHASRPRFRARKRDRCRFRIPQRVRCEGNRVRCPKVGLIRFRGALPAGVDRIKTATFSRERSGRWFVSLTFEVAPAVKGGGVHPAVGVDVGIVDLIVTSDGDRVPAPRNWGKSARLLARSHRRLSRCQRGSNGRVDAKRRLASQYERTRNRRVDFLQKQTTRLTNDYALICVEDLNIRGMARTKLSRGVHDAALGEFRRQLIYKSETSGCTVAVIERYFPSSKCCSGCGRRNATPSRRARHGAVQHVVSPTTVTSTPRSTFATK